MQYIIGALVLLLPGITLAQTGSLQELIVGVGDLINNYLIPFVIALAFLIFVFNVYRFFILNGSNEDGRENAKNLAIYSLLAFVLIVIFWGLINFIVRTTGIDTTPCENDTVSDYIISSLAPCSSPRAPRRPLDVPDTTAPGDGFGTGVDGVDDPITIPGGGTGPTSPTSPGLPTPGGSGSYETVRTAQTSIRSAAAPYFTTQINTDFGYNKDVVAPLFADLGATYSNSVTELNRLKAAVRLNELGVITDAQVTTYLNAYNAYAAAAGTMSPSGPITLAAVSRDLAVTPTDSVQARITERKSQTRQTLIDLLAGYNATNNVDSPDVNIDAAVENLYNTNDDPNTRYELMYEVFTTPAQVGGSSGNALPVNTQAKNAFIERFVSDLNTEKIYAGDLDLLQ